MASAHLAHLSDRPLAGLQSAVPSLRLPSLPEHGLQVRGTTALFRDLNTWWLAVVFRGREVPVTLAEVPKNKVTRTLTTFKERSVWFRKPLFGLVLKR